MNPAEKVLNGGSLTRDEALELYDAPIDELCSQADEIRKKFCADKFDACTIINAKSGRCPENCKFCAQSLYYDTRINHYPLMAPDEILGKAKNDASASPEGGVKHFGIVTSGKRLSDEEISQVCEAVSKIKAATNLKVCVSLGLLTEKQFMALKDSGVERIHNNLETSRNYFHKICSTHSFDDKINAIKSAQRASLQVCSGGIMGIGESAADRIDMAFTLRELGIKSVPVNMLNPVSGTPLAMSQILNEDSMRRITAIYRIILPDAFIRLAGGRGLLKDHGKSCFESGANAAITGDMLTTSGFTIKSDIDLFRGLGFDA